MKLSSNFAFPTMLKSVAWLRKIENCNQFSIFVFQPKHSKSLTELPKREGEGSICTVIFFCPCPPPLPSHATLLWKGGSRKFVFTMQSLFQT